MPSHLKVKSALTFARGHIKQIFEPICTKIRVLVRKQINVLQDTKGKSPKVRSFGMLCSGTDKFILT